MRLLFIRHGDPDYEHDTLTEQGVLEAEALAAFIGRLNPGTCYVSPLGRADLTARIALKPLGIVPAMKMWLQEFPARIDTEGSPVYQAAFPDARMPDGSWRRHIHWDMVPSYYAAHPELAEPEGWRNADVVRDSDMLPRYEEVAAGLDELLASYGYVRRDRYYEVRRETTETVTFFCHYGISSVLLSRLFFTSPFVPLHKLCMQTTSVTEVVTEEREPGVATVRALRIGDTTHLTLAGMEPSFAARFREVYSDTSKRG